MTSVIAAQTCQFPKRDEPWADHLAKMDAYMRAREAAAQIDPLSHLAGTPILLYSGAKDDVVLRPVMLAVGKQLAPLVNTASAIATIYSIPSEHAWPTSDRRAQPCLRMGPPFANFCDYDLAGVSLRHMRRAGLRPRGREINFLIRPGGEILVFSY